MKVGQVKRWTASRKMEVVLRLLSGELLDALSRELGLEIYLPRAFNVTLTLI